MHSHADKLAQVQDLQRNWAFSLLSLLPLQLWAKNSTDINLGKEGRKENKSDLQNMMFKKLEFLCVCLLFSCTGYSSQVLSLPAILREYKKHYFSQSTHSGCQDSSFKRRVGVRIIVSKTAYPWNLPERNFFQKFLHARKIKKWNQMSIFFLTSQVVPNPS